MSKFYCNNDKCEDFKKENTIPRFKIFYRNNKRVCADSKTGHELICDKCHMPVIEIEENIGICATFKSRENVNKRVNMDYWDKINREDDLDAMNW